MNEKYLATSVRLAITALFLATFGLASLNKWIPFGIPDGFINDFGETWLGSLPGGLILPYYTIAITETLVVVFFVMSLFKKEFLVGTEKKWMYAGLVMSLFVFVILSYGLRLIGNFGGTANTFFYFGATLVALLYVQYTKQE